MGSNAKRLLWLLLAASALLRFTLALRGGQRFFPDENRYLRSHQWLQQLEGRGWGAGLDHLLATPDHVGFTLVAAVPALLQRALIASSGLPQDRAAVDATAWLPAAVLSLASLAAIALVHAIARRSGADASEALLAAALMAGSTSMLYYSRHLLPYDSALALALAAALLGLRDGGGWARSGGVGALAGGAFLTYHGYWLSALAALALHAFHGSRAPRDVVRRAAAAGVGFALVPAALTAASYARERGLYLVKISKFSRLASTQTDFGEAAQLPWAYLWRTEHALLALWAVGAFLVVRGALRRDLAARRGLRWLAVAAGMYLLTLVLSSGLERVGVFGRQVRQLVPFLCLATAAGLAPWRASLRCSRPLFAAALAAQAIWNIAPALRQRFPRELARQLTREYGELARDTTVQVDADPEEKPVANARYVLLNARFLYPVAGSKDPPPGTTLFETAHPLEYAPYQYEGFLPAERHLLRTSGIAMRLVDTHSGRR
jgi:hypothetical protein